jgi:hypothetical protein
MVHIRLQRPARPPLEGPTAPQNLTFPMSAFDFGLSKQIDTFGGKKNFLPDSGQRFEANANKISH